MKGMRRDNSCASAMVLSRSLPSEAPVISVTFIGFWRARSASAIGTALASPARVKPDMPNTMPSWIRLAACSALTTRSRNAL